MKLNEQPHNNDRHPTLDDDMRRRKEAFVHKENDRNLSTDQMYGEIDKGIPIGSVDNLNYV